MKRLQVFLMLTVLLLPVTRVQAESGLLHPYTPATGYTYLTLGRLPPDRRGRNPAHPLAGTADGR